MSLFDRLLRAGAAKRSRQLHELVNQIGTLEPKLTDVTDEELRRMSDELRQRVSNGAELNEVEVEAFALVREVARRVIGLRHYDVQIYGGLVLARGMVAEMRTGEGKTLVATLPSYLHALTGKGVHVVTVNDYLASRDADWMGKIHRFLGLKVGLVVPGQSAAEKRTAYAADITYGTSNEFGFDYLRDNLAKSAAARMQRGRYFALVDEVDSVLIDEARTPLIISGPGSTDTDLCVRFADIAAALRRDEHYEVDETRRQVLINEDGVAKVEAILGVPNLYDNAQADYVSYLEAALRAKELFIRDVEYIVEGGEVKIVDEFTGRVLEGRRYSEGLHQAIEAKEKVKIQEEYHTLATVTIQNYFRSYEKLAGMTGTASTEDSELAQIYGLEVEQIPTNRPVIRVDHDDVVYTTAEAKWNAVIEDIVARHKKGQPVLVGTVSIEKSELVSKLLNKRGIPHQVLNAKHHAREAAIVAQAGRPGAVTVATNMAGRGVDILLGGNEEALAKAALEKQGLEEGSSEWEEAWPAELARQVEVVEADRERVKAAGGLYVLGTERHESRRIDNQLRGRSGRQGDPGESRFYLSFEDDVIRRFGGERFRALTSRLNFPEDLPIEAKMVTKSIERAQTSVEGMNFAARKRVLEYDEVTNTQRKVVYGWRDQVIDNPEAFSDLMDDWVDRVAREIIDTYADESGQLRGEDAARAATEFATWSGLDGSFIAEGGDATQLGNRAADLAYGYWDERRETYPEFGSSVGAAVLLSVIDRRWQDQLTDLDHLRSSTGLRASAGQNPLSEFQREAYDAFEAMREQVRYDTTRTMLHLRATEELTAEDRPMQLRTSGGSEAASAAPKTVKKATKVGRNDPCLCGSGLKFKRCHLGREDELAA